jgi:hypothetical protein
MVPDYRRAQAATLVPLADEMDCHGKRADLNRVIVRMRADDPEALGSISHAECRALLLLVLVGLMPLATDDNDERVRRAVALATETQQGK